MNPSLANGVKGIGLIVLGVALAYGAIRVGDADDAPGVSLLGILLMVALVVLGVKRIWSNAPPEGFESKVAASSEMNPRGLLSRTLATPVWVILGILALFPLLGMFALFRYYDAEESIPLTRNEVTVDATGMRVWQGTLLNPSNSEYRELAVIIRFLDANNQPVGEARGQKDLMAPNDSLPLQASLPDSAVRMQIYSLQWRTGRKNIGRLLGPYRPWEFGYRQYDPNR